jgi:hypothetical protein
LRGSPSAPTFLLKLGCIWGRIEVYQIRGDLMLKLACFIALFASLSAHAAPLTAPYTLEQIQAWIESEKIDSVETFISKLPEEHLKNFTLMHHSKSLHESSYENPRAILYGEKGQWIVSFNGTDTQAAGKKIEMMIYDQTSRSYGFHELDFSKGAPVLHANSQTCFSCHGSPARPIWDHYNQWEGAYGANDDKYSEVELTELQKFIAKAPSHPRFQFLKEVQEGYRILHPAMYNGYTIDRGFGNRNRQLTLRLYEQRYRDLAKSISEHPRFTEIKPILFYFLARCYKDPRVAYEGDGVTYEDNQIKVLMNDLIQGKDSLTSTPFSIFSAFDYVLARFDINTSDWYINSRTLPSYRTMASGTDRNAQSMTAYLLDYAPEYQDAFVMSQLADPLYPIPQANALSAKSCERFTSEARIAAQKLKAPLLASLPAPPTLPKLGLLPSICLKCHAQQPTAGKIYLPVQDLSARVRNGDRVLAEKLRSYITPDATTGQSKMPMRTNGDDAAFNAYKTNDYPALKRFVDQLLR